MNPNVYGIFFEEINHAGEGELYAEMVLNRGFEINTLLPEDQFKGVQREKPETVEGSPGPRQDWFAACGGGKPAWANFDYADALNEFLMLGNVATQFEGKLEFEPVAMKIVNNAEADAALRCEYRQGWPL